MVVQHAQRVTTVMQLVYFNRVVRVTLVSFVMVALFRPRPMKCALMDPMVLVLDVLAKDVLLVVTVQRAHTNLGDVRLVLLLIPKDKLTSPIVRPVHLVHTVLLKIVPNPLMSVRLAAIAKAPMTSPM